MKGPLGSLKRIYGGKQAVRASPQGGYEQHGRKTLLKNEQQRVTARGQLMSLRGREEGGENHRGEKKRKVSCLTVIWSQPRRAAENNITAAEEGGGKTKTHRGGSDE